MRRDRAASDRVVTAEALRPVAATYAAAADDMVRVIDREMRRRHRGPLTAADAAVLLMLVRRSLRQVMARTAATSAASAPGIVQAAILQTEAFLAATGTGLDPAQSPEIGREMGYVLHDIGRQRDHAMGVVGSRVEARIRAAVMLAVAAGSVQATATAHASASAAADIVGGALHDSAWDVARTTVTEASAVMNRGRNWAIIRAARRYPDVMSRWTEHVNDLTGQPMDKRVGQDSMVLHGQVTRPGGKFTMPEDSRAPRRMVGQSWTQPPNRPHDRCVLTIWRPNWGIPAWIYANGQRVTIVP